MNIVKVKSVQIVRIAGFAAIYVLTAFLFVPQGFAQLGAPSTQSQPAQATPLPLSGRAGQNGSVAAVETPVAGTTTSVNTINPTVQAQGPYSGSASSTAKIPFSGKLSFREAIARGLDYNLGGL